MAIYEFYLTDDAGRRITILKNIAFASISRAVKGYGTCHIGIPFQAFNVRPVFLPDRRLEVWRSPKNGATLRREGSFFLRKFNVYTREEDNVQIIEFYGRSPIDILRRQSVTSTTLAKYQKTDFIDDMMKEIVSENFVSPAQTAPSGELTVDGEESLGPSISHSFFSQNVLDVLKDLQDISITLSKEDSSNLRIYFDVIEGSPLSSGGYGYTFRTYANLRGTDRITGKVFSVENGNVKAPSYYEDHLDSFTVASILNLSTPAANGSATSPDATLSRWNTIVSAQQSSETTAALNESKADSVLQDGEAEKSFNVTILDSPGSNRQPRSLYGVDWDLGDLLPVRYADKNINVEVNTVYLSVDEDGKENIVGMTTPRIETPAAAPEPPNLRIENPQSNFVTSGATSLTESGYTPAAGSNRLVVAILALNRDGAGNPSGFSATFGGTSMTLEDSQMSGNGGVVVFSIKEASFPSTPANVVANWTGACGGVLIVYTILDADQTKPFGTWAKATGSSTTPSVNVTSEVGDLVIDAVAMVALVADTFTVGAGQTEIASVHNGGGSVIRGASSYESGAASVTMSWTNTSSFSWAIMGVTVNQVVIP